MTTASTRRILGIAAGLAVIAHLTLFLAVRPASGGGIQGTRVPPETRYPAGSAGGSSSAADVRRIWSPVLFSLPSELGFSRELLNERPSTGLTFKQPDDLESYLTVIPAPGPSTVQVDRSELMVTATERGAPNPPSPILPEAEARPALRRVYMAPELKERLVGGIVLPPELNRRGEGNTAWVVRADLSISTEGLLRHVMLEQPLEDEALNVALIRLLHGLRFRSGEGPVDGHVEIYSPAADPEPGEDS